jgi:hypothetical protein
VIYLRVQSLKNFLQLHLFKCVLALKVELGMDNELDHALRPRDAGQVETVSDVYLLGAGLDIVEDAQTVALLLLVLNPVGDVLLALQ